MSKSKKKRPVIVKLYRCVCMNRNHVPTKVLRQVAALVEESGA